VKKGKGKEGGGTSEEKDEVGKTVLLSEFD